MTAGYTPTQIRAMARLRLGRQARAGGGQPTDWREWLAERFPAYVGAPFAERHTQLWDWLWAIERGSRPPPFIAIWPRGGAKSTTAELGCVACAARQSRRYALYVSETQEQADKHVQTIAGLMERAGFDRALNKYGSSKGWRRNQIRTADGFKVDAIGLDTAARGFKIDEDRPDLIILDDLDGKHDTPAATQKKIESLTMTILPAMAVDGAVLGVQNVIHANSIFARLADRRADFLIDRIVSGPFPAIEALQYEYRDDRYQITGGLPTWEGQSLTTCQGFIDTWGLLAFLVECQHDVAKGGQYYETWQDSAHFIEPLYHQGWTYWGALDYGFAHPLAFGVFGQDGNGDVHLMGEWVAQKRLIPEHSAGMDGLLARLGLQRADLRTIVAGHDCWASRGGDDPETIADKFDKLGWRLERAVIDRVNGWNAIRTRLGRPADGQRPSLFIWKTAPRTARCLASLVHDPKRPEDVLKVNADADGNGGDDEADCLRYGVMEARADTWLLA